MSADQVVISQNGRTFGLAQLCGSTMAKYRVFFRSEDNQIIGRDDFSAPNDRDAMRVARAVCEACSDRCRSFEVWEGVRHVDPRGLSLAHDALTALVDTIISERVMAIRDSDWIIAESQRLLEESERLLEARAKARQLVEASCRVRAGPASQ
jgi:hypothetical protein